jgi:hypothetical protein
MLPTLYRPISASLLLLLASLTWPLTASAQPKRHPKLDGLLNGRIERKDDSPQRVIIRARDGKLDGLVTLLLRQKGIAVGRVHSTIGAVAASLTTDDVRDLAELGSVFSISADAVVRADQASGCRCNCRLAIASGSR